MGQAGISATLNLSILQERDGVQRSGDILVPEILIVIEYDSREARQEREQYGDIGRLILGVSPLTNHYLLPVYPLEEEQPQGLKEQIGNPYQKVGSPFRPFFQPAHNND